MTPGVVEVANVVEERDDGEVVVEEDAVLDSSVVVVEKLVEAVVVRNVEISVVVELLRVVMTVAVLSVVTVVVEFCIARNAVDAPDALLNCEVTLVAFAGDPVAIGADAVLGEGLGVCGGDDITICELGDGVGIVRGGIEA